MVGVANADEVGRTGCEAGVGSWQSLILVFVEGKSKAQVE